jgi:hypothetical protein
MIPVLSVVWHPTPLTIFFAAKRIQLCTLNKYDLWLKPVRTFHFLATLPSFSHLSSLDLPPSPRAPPEHLKLATTTTTTPTRQLATFTFLFFYMVPPLIWSCYLQPLMREDYRRRTCWRIQDIFQQNRILRGSEMKVVSNFLANGSKLIM